MARKNSAAPRWFTIISVVALVAILATFLPNLIAPAAPTPATPAPTSTLAASPTPDECAPANVQGAANEFNAISREFDDYSVIAQNTPRQDLAEPIAEMQRIRRTSEAFVVPGCLAALKDLQLAYMNAFIDTLVALYSTLTNPNEELTEGDVANINQGMGLALQYHEQYLDELARVLGVTRVPTETPVGGEGTPQGPSEPTATP